MSPRRTEPLVGRSRAPRICKSVLLPEPEGPRMAAASPGVMARSTSRNTTRSPDRVGYDLPRWETVSVTGMSPGGLGYFGAAGKMFRVLSHASQRLGQSENAKP